MDIVIIATKTCHHRPHLVRMCESLGVPYDVKFAEDHPALCTEYEVRESPVVVVGDSVVFRKTLEKEMPSLDDVRAWVALDLDSA